MTMRIDAFLRESPMFAILHAARRLDTLANEALAEDDLSFAEGLILTAILFEEPRPIKPSQLADTFGTTRATSATVSRLSRQRDFCSGELTQ
jgi:DNA-binding MarR family transcriptional regulator